MEYVVWAIGPFIGVAIGWFLGSFFAEQNRTDKIQDRTQSEVDMAFDWITQQTDKTLD